MENALVEIFNNFYNLFYIPFFNALESTDILKGFQTMLLKILNLIGRLWNNENVIDCSKTDLNSFIASTVTIFFIASLTCLIYLLIKQLIKVIKDSFEINLDNDYRRKKRK